MSASGTEMKFALTYWPMEKATPQTTAGSHVCRRPRLPSTT